MREKIAKVTKVEIGSHVHENVTEICEDEIHFVFVGGQASFPPGVVPQQPQQQQQPGYQAGYPQQAGFQQQNVQQPGYQQQGKIIFANS